MSTETGALRKQREKAQKYLTGQRFLIRRKARAVRWITAPAPNPDRHVVPSERVFEQAESA